MGLSLSHRVSLEFVAGPADGIRRTYKTPAPCATTALHGEYVLSVRRGRCFYAHVPTAYAFMEDDEEFYTLLILWRLSGAQYDGHKERHSPGVQDDLRALRGNTHRQEQGGS
jgi:hypothetical protein